MPFFMSFKFQDFSNFNSMNISYFNDYLNSFLIFILMMILFLFFFLVKFSFNLSLNKNIDSNLLELFWTMVPSIMILLISIPSMVMLYFTDEFKKPLMDLKIMGNQWYWSYLYMNMNYFNSYIFPSLMNRCISTDNSIILPSSINIRTLISSTDVIHSWTIPSLMLKMDAIPGRLNSFNMISEKSMKMKGQCSEICGSNHSFMPISLMMMKFSSKNFFKYNFLNYKSVSLWWNYQISPTSWIISFFMIMLMISSFSFKKMNILNLNFKKYKNMKMIYAI